MFQTPVDKHKIKDKSALIPPESIKVLSEADQFTIRDLYVTFARFIELEENTRDVLCNILMGRKLKGRDVVLAGKIVAKIKFMEDNDYIILEELELSYLKRVFYPEDNTKKGEPQVFTGFELTPKMYPFLDALNNTEEYKAGEVIKSVDLKIYKPSNEQPVEESLQE